MHDLISVFGFIIGFFSTLLFKNAVATTSTYINPVVASNHPDPGVLTLPDGSGFIVVSTSDQSSFGQPTFPILYSQDLVNWTPVRDK